MRCNEFGNVLNRKKLHSALVCVENVIVIEIKTSFLPHKNRVDIIFSCVYFKSLSAQRVHTSHIINYFFSCKAGVTQKWNNLVLASLTQLQHTSQDIDNFRLNRSQF